jgi:energy-converting hydrogenase B subunit D
MTTAILVVLLLGVAALGTATVLTRETTRQSMVFAGYGLTVGVLMLALQAPDVALSQIAVGSAVVPLLVLLTVAKCQRVLKDRERR